MEEAKTYYSKSKTSKKYINNFKHFLLDILGLEEVINSYLDFEKYNKIINNYQESNNNISYNNSNIFNNKFISFKNISENITYNKYKCEHCVKIQNKNESESEINNKIFENFNNNFYKYIENSFSYTNPINVNLFDNFRFKYIRYFGDKLAEIELSINNQFYLIANLKYLDDPNNLLNDSKTEETFEFNKSKSIKNKISYQDLKKIISKNQINYLQSLPLFVNYDVYKNIIDVIGITICHHFFPKLNKEGKEILGISHDLIGNSRMKIDKFINSSNVIADIIVYSNFIAKLYIYDIASKYSINIDLYFDESSFNNYFKKIEYKHTNESPNNSNLKLLEFSTITNYSNINNNDEEKSNKNKDTSIKKHNKSKDNNLLIIKKGFYNIKSLENKKKLIKEALYKRDALNNSNKQFNKMFYYLSIVFTEYYKQITGISINSLSTITEALQNIAINVFISNNWKKSYIIMCKKKDNYDSFIVNISIFPYNTSNDYNQYMNKEIKYFKYEVNDNLLNKLLCIDFTYYNSMSNREKLITNNIISLFFRCDENDSNDFITDKHILDYKTHYFNYYIYKTGKLYFISMTTKILKNMACIIVSYLRVTLLFTFNDISNNIYNLNKDTTVNSNKQITNNENINCKLDNSSNDINLSNCLVYCGVYDLNINNYDYVSNNNNLIQNNHNIVKDNDICSVYNYISNVFNKKNRNFINIITNKALEVVHKLNMNKIEDINSILI